MANHAARIDAIEQIAGVRPAFMRPRTSNAIRTSKVPYSKLCIAYGEYNDLVLDVAGEREQSIVMWDFECVASCNGVLFFHTLNPEISKRWGYNRIDRRKDQ